MILAVIDDTPYRILLILHIVTAMAAFAPAFVHPVILSRLSDAGTDVRGPLLHAMTRNGRILYGPALLVNGLLGFGLAGMSDKIYKMSQGWLVAAFLIWVVMNGLLHAVILPAEKQLSAGDDAAQRKLDAGGALLSILLIVMLYLMVFKPGL
jgi:uncharacterized membrane protein